MARLARILVSGYPHHIILRGNNRQPIFNSSADYQLMLGLLQELTSIHQVEMHSYVLMGNHLHLLVTPRIDNGLSKCMQTLGSQYVRYFNKKQGRTGTLWEGRFKSSLIETEKYFLACMVYIDLNPVRAGMVTEPGLYPWSSHNHYAGKKTDPWLTPHPMYWNLGNTPFAREIAYTNLVQQGISSDQQSKLTQTVLGGWALGDEGFLQNLQKLSSRRLTQGKPGRPFSVNSTAKVDSNSS
jgi:putative transposase